MKKNIVIYLFAVFAVFVVITFKFAHIQLLQAEELQKDVVEQRVKKVKEPSDRGAIKDRSGNVLANSLNVKDIAVYPNLVKSEKRKEEIAKTLSDHLEDVTYEETLEMVGKTNEDGTPAQWVRVARSVDPETANTLKQSKVSSYIEITNSPNRNYLNGSLGSNILGFVNDESEPGAGLELSLNHYLAGIPGYRVTEFDHMGEPIPIGMETISRQIPGNDVNLTINSYIQYILEDAAEEAMKEMDADAIHLLTMDPNNGEILGMASYPNFDPNDYQSYDEDTYNSHAASFVYEPGSTFKAIYTAMALDAGTINENSYFYDGGSTQENGATLSNWNHQGIGNASLEDIIVHSSNVGMVEISRTLSVEQVHKGLTKAGFGQKTGIELPNEEPGIFAELDYLKIDPIMKATQSYGHGIATTPLQIATGISEIVNGGYDISPTLLKEVKDENGETLYKHEYVKDEDNRVWSQHTADLVKGYMNASWNSGSMENSIDGYQGGYKTGTTTRLDNGSYGHGIVGSIVGFAPYEDPKYVTIAVVDNPKGDGYNFGSTTGGPIFKKVMEEIMRYENVPKDGETNEGDETENTEDKQIEFEIEDYYMEFYEEAKRDLEEKHKDKIEVIQEGSGDIVIGQSYRYKNNKLEIHIETSPVSGEGKTYIPNLIGLDPREALKLFEDQGIEVEFIGQGVVFDQSIQVGEYDNRINKIRLWLD